MAKVLELQLQPLQWIFRVDFLYNRLVWSPCSLRDSWESSPTPQFESSNSLALSILYGPTITSMHSYWKTIALTICIFVSKVMSVLYFFLIFYVSFFFFNFYWRIIASQYYTGFCHISPCINHRYTYVSSLSNLPSISHVSHPSRLSQAPDWAPGVTQQILTGYLFAYGNVHVFILLTWLVPPQMERYTIFLDWKNQYCENDCLCFLIHYLGWS